MGFGTDSLRYNLWKTDTNQERLLEPTEMRAKPISALCFALILVLILPAQGWANTGVVYFKNGDKLTGEVKSLEKGLLRFKTDATGTIEIEWDDIAAVSSDQNVQVETEEGLRFLGHLVRSEEPGKVTMVTRSGPFEIDAQRVIAMTPIKETVVGRFDGDVTAGYDFTKATEVKQLNLGLDLDYRTELRVFSLDFSATTSDSAGADSSQRHSLFLDYRRLRPDRWITTGTIQLTRNDQLGIDLRTSIGAGGGRILRQTNSTHLLVESGLLLSRENVAGGLESEDSVEAVGTVRWDWFRYDLPELDLSTTFQLIPSLSVSGRVRSEVEIKFSWEFIDDFFWIMRFYNSSDNKPSDPTAEKNDYGVTTSIGWNF